MLHFILYIISLSFFIFFIVLTIVFVSLFLQWSFFLSSFDLFHRIVKQEARAPDDSNRRTDSTGIII